MNEGHITEMGLAAALLTLGFKLLTTYNGRDGELIYVFFYEDAYEKAYDTCVLAYLDGTLKVNARTFRMHERMIADGSYVREHIGETVTIPGPAAKD